jgi:hypothetical protein
VASFLARYRLNTFDRGSCRLALLLDFDQFLFFGPIVHENTQLLELTGSPGVKAREE